MKEQRILSIKVYNIFTDLKDLYAVTSFKTILTCKDSANGIFNANIAHLNKALTPKSPIKFMQTAKKLKQNSKSRTVRNSENGYSKLMLAIEEKNLEYTELLLSSGADVNQRNKAGQSALILAAKSGRVDLVEILIANGADVRITNKLGQTALFVACYYNHSDVVVYLLENNADVNASDKRGWTPLMIACHYGYTYIVSLLLEHGADILAEDSFGKSAMDRATSQEVYKILSLHAQRELKQYIPNDFFKPIRSPSDLKSLHPSSSRLMLETARTADSGSLSKRSIPQSHLTKQVFHGKKKNQQKHVNLTQNDADQGDGNEGQTRSSNVSNYESHGSSDLADSKLKRAVSPNNEKKINSSRIGANQVTPREDISKKTPRGANTKLSNSSKQAGNETHRAQTPSVERKVQSKESKSQALLKTTKDNEPFDKSISARNLLEANSPPRKFSNEPNNKESHRLLVQDQKTEQILLSDFKGYLKDYSQCIQQNIKKKLSYSLAFEIKKNVIECRKQFIDSIFGNLKKMHQELLFSLHESLKIRGNTTSVLNKHQIEFETSFDQMLQALQTKNNDQNFYDSFYIQTQELDTLLAKEAEDKFLRVDSSTVSYLENEIAKGIRDQLNQDISESFAAIINVVLYEFSKMSNQFKTTWIESIEPGFQTLIRSCQVQDRRDSCKDTQTEEIENKFLEEQFPEPIEKLPKQQPEVTQLEHGLIHHLDANENQAPALKTDLTMNESEDLKVEGSGDSQKEEEKPQQTENLLGESGKKRSFGKELNDLVNVVSFGYYPNKPIGRKRGEYSSETFGMNQTSHQSCQFNQNSELTNGSGLDTLPSNFQPKKQQENCRFASVENSEALNPAGTIGQQFHQPPWRKKCFGIRTASMHHTQRDTKGSAHLRVTFTNKSQETGNQSEIGHYRKQHSNLGQSLYSESSYETTNELESFLSRNEEATMVQSFTNLAESQNKELQPYHLASPGPGLRGIIQQSDLPSANNEADNIHRLGNTSPKVPQRKDLHPMRTQNTLPSANFQDPTTRYRPETREDLKKISVQTGDYRVSEMIEEMISKSNDSIEEARFHHETLPPYYLSKENFSISSASPDLDIIKAIQRSNEVLSALKSSVHASKGRFEVFAQSNVQLRAFSPRNYAQNTLSEKSGHVSPLHRLGSNNILVSENFNTQEEADQPQNISQQSQTGPVFLPILPMPIASSQIKSKASIKDESPIGYSSVPGLKVEPYFKSNYDFMSLKRHDGKEDSQVNDKSKMSVSGEESGYASVPNLHRGRYESGLNYSKEQPWIQETFRA